MMIEEILKKMRNNEVKLADEIEIKVIKKEEEKNEVSR